VAVINGYVAKKVAATTAAIAATSEKMTSLELRVDGRLTEILDLTRRVTRAETLNEQKQISSEDAGRVSGTKSITNL
jgi:hypothetical protein